MTYGIPYMGSKSGIAEWVVAHLPPGEVLVDVFAGGCAVTHAAFCAWCRAQTSPLVVSEYAMPEDFRVLAERRKTVTLAATGTTYATERLYALNYAPLRQAALEFAT